MTEKLYYMDAYIKEFSATVLSSVKAEDGYAVTLDRTAFFPEEGGQYSDSGYIGEARVISVSENGGVITHLTDSPLEVGSRVECKIDFDERYEKMQCHTAEHILSGLFHSLYGLNNVGFHLGREDVTMDISRPLTSEEIERVERLANEVIYENVTVQALFPSREELVGMEYRSKLDITENVRIIKIGEYDSCACCAPHVAMTGEIGSIKILDSAKLRGGMRLFITAGKRAYEVYRKMYDNLSKISHALSVPRLECGEATLRYVSEHEALLSEYKAFRLSYFESESEKILATDGSVISVYPDASIDELRAIANAAKDRVEKYLVLLSGTDESYKYVIATKSIDLKLEIKNINAALGGKGGGSSNMVAGSFTATLESIRKYFV